MEAVLEQEAPQVAQVQDKKISSERPRTFDEAEVRLAESLPGYESRPQQQAFARKVETSLGERQHLIAEAGCGVGKSLGYLIPAIQSGKRVIVSTATRALQDQIANKDVPFLADNLGVPFSFALLKGRSNYFCANKAADADPGDFPNIAAMLKEAFERENDPTFLGERDSFSAEVETREWMAVAADTDDCQAHECRKVGLCFAQRAKERAAESQVVIVNHALFLTDLVVRESSGGFASLLDQYHAVVFDEAHELEEYAGKSLGSAFKEAGVRHLVSQVRNFSHRHLDGDVAARVEELYSEVLTATTALWAVLEPGRIREATLMEHADEFVNMANAMTDLTDYLLSSDVLETVPSGEYDRVKKRRDMIARRCASMTRRFGELVTKSFDDLVRWVEIENFRGEQRKLLKTSPITVAPYLRENLFGEENGVTAILVSATMSVEGSFDYISGRLGIDEYEGIDVGTPFDYEKQSALYVPSHLPEPTQAQRAAWSSMMAVEIAELVKASKGRALLLFTSNREMKLAYDTVSSRLPYECMMQGQAPNKVLAQRFMDEPDSVLFATRSFMTGVDFRGDACTLVVIDKLPFPVPTEPLTEARCEAIKRAGGSDFKEYTIPVMSLVLKQAFGRLIRHRDDSGIVAILDPRLTKKGYGKTILRSLPPARQIDEMAEVESFYSAVEEAV